MTNHIGLHANRVKENPLEKRFQEYWQKEQTGRLLEYLLGDGNTPKAASLRDEQVAATVVQWLGSPVGRNFLGKVLGVEILNPDSFTGFPHVRSII